MLSKVRPYTLLILYRVPYIIASQRHPCGRTREAQRGDAAHIRKPHGRPQNPKIRRRVYLSVLCVHSSIDLLPMQVVELDAAYRERVHQYQLHTYFYGHVLQPPPGLAAKAFVQGGEQTPDLTLQLSPLSTSVNFGDITIYRIGEGTSCPPCAPIFTIHDLAANP